MRALDEYRIFLFDLDGTIATEGGVPSPQCLASLTRLLSMERHVGIVTARAIGEMRGVVDSFRSCVDPARFSGQMRFFPSTASEVYRISATQPHPLELVQSLHTAAERDALAAVSADLQHLVGITVIERGAQLTICATAAGMTQVRWSLRPHLSRVRCVFASPEFVHVLPLKAGKHRALEHYSSVRETDEVAVFGDGFYEVPEIGIRGNDMDFVGRVRTCIHVGKLKPRDPGVLHLPLGHDGPTSTAMILECMESKSTRSLASAHSVILPGCARLRDEIATVASSDVVRTFVFKIFDYLFTTLEPAELDRRASAAVNALRGAQPLGDAIRLLVAQTPLDRGFGRWAGFEGELDWVLAWLWDEHVSRPGVPIAGHFSDRVRAPVMPEELMISLLRVLPYVARGDRVVLIGKDAECLEPLVNGLIRIGRVLGLLSSGSLEPIGLKVSARKASPREVVDASEHLASGSVARQLRSFLRHEELDEPLRAEQRRQVLGAARMLPPDQQNALAQAFEWRFERALDTMSRGALIARIGDLMPSKEFGDFVAAARAVIYSLQSRLSSIPPGTLIDVMTLLAGEPSLGARSAEIALQFSTLTGRATVEDRDDCHLLSRLLFAALGDGYASLRSLEFPFAPVLRALMEGARIRNILSPRVLFVDSSFNGGTTVLFLRALRSIVAPESLFQFAAIGGLILHEQLRNDLEWHGHPYVPLLMEEGAPHTFDFFYDENDEKVMYASIVGPDCSASDSRTPSDEHIESFCRTHENDVVVGEGMPQPLEFRDLVRWWLRRDRVWEMYVLADKLRFRWPHWRVVRNQQRAIALARRLDESVDRNTSEQLRDRDRELAAYETRRLLREWLGRREEWLRRGFAFADQMAAHPQLLRDYISKPSAAAWHRLQRKLVANLRPGNLGPFDRRAPE